MHRLKALPERTNAMSENTTVNEELLTNEAQDKKKLLAQKILLAVYSLVAVAFLVVYLLLFAVGYLCFGIFFAVMAVTTAVRVARKKLPKDTLKFMTVSVLLVVVLVFLVASTPSPIYNGFKGQYEWQMKYISSYNSLTYLEFFPDKLYDSAEEYDITFMPSVMQGNGCLAVDMKLSEQDIEKVRNEYSKLAFASFTLNDYHNADYSKEVEQELFKRYLKEMGYWESYQMYGIDGSMPETTLTFDEDHNLERIDIEWSEITQHRNISLYVSENMRVTDNAKGCEVYLIRLGYDHAHSSCVIIDTYRGLVSFSQLG